MKTAFLAAIAAALLAAATPVVGAPKAFEGKVTYKMTTNRGVMHMTYYAKGEHLRTEVAMGEGQTAVMLLDYGKHEMTMLIPGQKMYMVRPLPTPSADDAAGEAAPPPETAAPDVRRTGQYETILGRKCEKIVIKTGEHEVDVWGAVDMGVFMNANLAAGPMGRGRPVARPAWEVALRDKGFFPLRVVTRDASGNEVNQMEVTAIDPTPPDDALFSPPADYRKFAMPAMPGMGGMNPFKR